MFAIFSRQPSTVDAYSRDVEILRDSPLFDAVWYRHSSADLRNTPVDCARHYLTQGAADGRNPHALFDTNFYLQTNGDVVASGMNPLIHYILFGGTEGRNPHPLFDAGFYLQNNDDVAAAGMNPLTHYILFGAKEGRSPHPLFDASFYLHKNPDVAASGENPLIHYILFGSDEGRDPNPSFSTSHYTSVFPDVDFKVVNPLVHYINNPQATAPVSTPTEQAEEVLLAESEEMEDIRELTGSVDPAVREVVASEFDIGFYLGQNPALRGLDPIDHYILIGAQTGFDPNPDFSSAFYLDVYADVRTDSTNPLYHFLRWGRAEGRLPKLEYIAPDVRELAEREFDADYYRSQHPNLRGVAPLDHFLTAGWRDGYDPSAEFSLKDYLRLAPDVKVSGQNPFLHYVRWGRAEDRIGKIVNRRGIKPSKTLAPLLFVGHDAIQAGAQVVLLEVVRWYAQHTRRPISVLLLGAGRLIPLFAELADVYVFHNNLQEDMHSQEFQDFINKPFAVAYVNSVSSGEFHHIFDRYLQPNRVPLVLHVHELSKVIRNDEDGFRRLQSRASSFIAVSERVKDCLVDEFGCDERKIHLSNAFIRPQAYHDSDVAVFKQAARDALGLGRDDFVIIGCGTVYWRKGPDLFLEAAIKLLESGTVRSLKFVWIGDGPDFETLRAAAAAAHVQEHVSFIGFRADANRLLAAADIFFMSSREDPFPLVCLESAHFAIPIVYFRDATGISEFTRDDAGIGVSFGDTTEAGAVLEALALDHGKRERMGRIGRHRVMSGFTTEIVGLRIAQHIKDVAGLIPDVSVIVPTYNLEKYIAERIESILSQTIQDFEVIILDNCSTDSTYEVARPYAADPRVTLIRNPVNSGTPFKQWKLGSDLAKSQILWIAEGDDSASENFLEVLLPSFDDNDVSMAFCPSIIMDSHGVKKPGILDPYYAVATFPFHRDDVVMDGFAAVEAGFGSICLIVNASSAIMRKSSVSAGLVVAADTYVMSGDWIVYLSALTDGKLYYSTRATNYFRRHTGSMVHRTEGTPVYFDERHRIASFVVNNFNISKRTFETFLAINENEWRRFRHRNPGQSKSDFLRHETLRQEKRARWPIPPMRIGFYVHGMLFSKGGIERLAANLANHLTRRGHSVWIFCRVWGHTRPIYPVNESVNLVPVFDENDVENSVSRMRLEAAKLNLDCFVPMLSEWLFEPIVEALSGIDVPILASEHNDPWKIEELWWPREKRLECFARVDGIHLLLNRYVASLPAEMQSKVTVVPNGIPIRKNIASASYNARAKRFIGVGRLALQKRFDRLIKAFARIQPEIPDWRLDIYGEGPDRAKLQDLIDQHDARERICLCGQTERIHEEMINSSVFVMASEFEGFPIVFIEAKMAGLPTIAYSTCNGPNDLIHHGEDGLLVDHDESGDNLAAAMLALAKDEALRTKMASRVRNNLSNFDLEVVGSHWEQMIARLVADVPPSN